MCAIDYEIKFLLCLFALNNCYGGEILQVHTHEIFSIEEPTWVFKSGMNKGRTHDRQDIGIVLLESATLIASQVNQNFDQTLSIRLLGDDQKTDRLFSVNNAPTRIQGDLPLVPFIETPFGAINATIEYYVDGPYHQLPIYQKGDDEDEFFRTWELHDSSYALIKNKYFQLLIPKCDKNLAKNLSSWNYDSLDSLIDHYESLFKFYDELAGFDDTTPTNRNSDNRFFLRADRHGSGGAYYGGSWTSTSNPTTRTWLTTTWGHLHEIGHGYQPSFIDMTVGEVTNNLFGTLFQFHMHGADATNISWVFDYGDKKTTERNFHSNMRNNDCKYEELRNLCHQLIVLLTLTEKAGSSALTKLYQAHREAANGNNPKFERRLPELLNRHYSDHARLDFAPVLEKLGLAPQPREAQRNRQRGYRPVAILTQVVHQTVISKARKILDLNRYFTTNYQLVTNNEIAFLGMLGNLTITLEKNADINDFSNVLVQIKDGEKIIREKTIKGKNENTIYFSNVPNGVYSVEIFGAPMVNSEMTSHYVYVKNKINKFTIGFTKIYKSKLLTQTLEFLGLGRNKFAEFIVDLNNSSATFVVTSTEPHSYYANLLYASVKIITSEGKILYEKYLNGTNGKILFDHIPIEENYYVEIYHDEPSRLQCDDYILNNPELINRFQITKFGLKNLKLDYDPQIILMFKIDKFARTILADDECRNTSIHLSHDKKHLSAAIRSLDREYEIIYNKKYKCLLPESLKQNLTHNDSITVTFNTKIELLEGVIVQLKNGDYVLQEQVVKGKTLIFKNIANGVYSLEFSGGPGKLEHNMLEKNFSLPQEQTGTVTRLIDNTFHLYGLNGQIGVFETFLNEGLALFKITTKDPHVYYGNGTFISLNITSSANITKYQRVVFGANTKLISDTVHLEEGDNIELFHAEIGWRLHCDADIIDKKQTTNKWRVTKYGLQNLNIKNSPLYDLLKKIDTKAPLVIDDLKKSRLRILSLEEPYKTYFENRHSHLFPPQSSNQMQTLKSACDENITLSSYDKKLIEFQKLDVQLRETLRDLKDIRQAILYLDNQYQKLYMIKYEELFDAFTDFDNTV